MRRHLPALGLLAAGLALTACGRAEPAVQRHVVMVSGRDDHGLLAASTLPLTSEPGGGDRLGPVGDGTLATVRAVRGNQVQVSTRGVTGWIDDFSLRGDLRLVGPPPACTLELLPGVVAPAGTRVEVLRLEGDRAQVRPLDGPRTAAWVRQRAVTELAPAPGQACPDLGSGRTRP